MLQEIFRKKQIEERIPMMTISLLGFNIESLNDIEESLLKFLLIIPFSWLITHYLEQPMLRWGKKIEKKL